MAANDEAPAVQGERFMSQEPLLGGTNMNTVTTSSYSAPAPTASDKQWAQSQGLIFVSCTTAGCEHYGSGHYLDDDETPIHRAAQTVVAAPERPLWRISFDKFGDEPWALALWVSDDTLTPEATTDLVRVLKHADRLLSNLDAGRELLATPALHTPAKAAAERREGRADA